MTDETLGQRFKSQAERSKEQEDFLFKCLDTMRDMTKLAEQTRAEYSDSLAVSVFPVG